ncbi:MAG: hypothetical protein WAU39_09700 [Polyangiales bacterium]
MRILVQTGDQPCPAAGRAWAGWLIASIALSWSAGEASAQAGQIRCGVTENGNPARGTIVVEQNGREAAADSCSGTLSVPPGRYQVTVRVDGVLDNPAKTVRVEVKEGKTVPVTVDFRTGVIEVRIETHEQRGTGIVTVNQLGKRIGTLGLGVGTHLSAGRYEIIVRLGHDERRYAVDLKAGQRRLVRARF